MKISIITGGNSSERKISLISAKAVKNALRNTHQVQLFDLRNGLSKLKKVSKNFDLFFPVLHGEEGEGGELQKFLASINKPFIGGDWKGFKEGWFKISFKKFCDKNQIKTADWKIIKNTLDIERFGFPCVLKTDNGGSSKEVAILKTEKDLKSPQSKHILNLGQKMMVERFIPGIEITVGVLGEKALPVLEIVPPEGKWFDYKNKYAGTSNEIPNAPSLSGTERKAAQKTAEKIHQQLKLGEYSRTDFIVSDRQIYALEVNTIPGLTSESLMPKAAKAEGLSFPQFLEKLLEFAQKRHKNL